MLRELTSDDRGSMFKQKLCNLQAVWVHTVPPLTLLTYLHSVDQSMVHCPPPAGATATATGACNATPTSTGSAGCQLSHHGIGCRGFNYYYYNYRRDRVVTGTV